MKKYYLRMGINNMEICLTILKVVFQFAKFLVYKLTTENRQVKIKNMIYIRNYLNIKLTYKNCLRFQHI